MHTLFPIQDAINPKIFINLMDWILIGEASKKLVISKENVVGLFSAATYLGIQGKIIDLLTSLEVDDQYHFLLTN